MLNQAPGSRRTHELSGKENRFTILEKFVAQDQIRDKILLAAIDHSVVQTLNDNQ
jgi:hypothetical protein